jgi:hypothetical protein
VLTEKGREFDALLQRHFERERKAADTRDPPKRRKA